MKTGRLALAMCCYVLIGLQSSYGQVSLPRLISSGMVLQRDVPIHIWGWAGPNEKVTIRIDKKTYSTVAGGDLKWTILLPALKEGGPYNMQIDGINHIELRNVYIGDVWICSGQSNMELPMERVKEKYPNEIAHADNPAIRQFSISTKYDFNGPLDDLSSGRWEGADPQNLPQFSATAYFFAKTLFEKYHVPIGLIKASSGGAPAEAWLSEGALREFPDYLEKALKFRDTAYTDSIRRSDRAGMEAWYGHIWQTDKGLREDKPWYDPGYDASGWQTMQLPGYWEDQGLKSVNGVVWFRKEIDVPAVMTGGPVLLSLGCIVDRDSVFVNGVFTGTTGYQYPPRRYTIPAGLLKTGKNIIVVRVINSAGRGGFVPGKPYKITGNNQTVDLTGAWQYKTGAMTDPIPGTMTFSYQPMGLYNGMIAPLRPYTIKGVIWYQGESNTSKGAEYRKLFPALIRDWRSQRGEARLPFLYVQLPGFASVKDQPSESGWAEIREAQRRTLKAVPNTGMAVTFDIGEWNDLHPLNKEDVGKRLALVAEKVAYEEKRLIAFGPMYESRKIESGRILIRFSNTSITDERENLIVKGGGELKGFTIAGADNKYVWAKAKIDGKDVFVWSDAVPNPVSVRYAWADNPEGANLANKEGLLASPFETND